MAVGRYELVYELAHSYLGPLWAVHSESGDASHVALLRQVSLARLDADTRVRLLEAAWQAMEIRHERICPVSDVVASDGELGVVSDYVEGQTLRALQGLASVRRTPMPISVALRILIDICEAVSAVHHAYREFGDETVSLYGGVSADSVIVGTNGRAYLTDVALSSASSAIESLGGNPDRIAYSAPEQVSSPPAADARTDVFAIGILAWELLSNRRLFLGSDKAVTQKVLVAKIPRLDEVKRRGDFEIPEALLGTVMKALEREARTRFQSVDELLSAFHASGVPAAEDSVVGAYVQSLAEGVLDRAREALKDSTGGRVELGSRVQSKLPEQRAAPVAASPTRVVPDSVTDTVPIPGAPMRDAPEASPAHAERSPSPGPLEARARAPQNPVTAKAEEPKSKPAASPLKPRPIAFETKPRLPVAAENKAKPGGTDPRVRPAAEAKPVARRATILGVAPAGLAASGPGPGSAARKPAVLGAPPVTTAQTGVNVLPGKHRPRQPTMIGIPPPAANAAPQPSPMALAPLQPPPAVPHGPQMTPQAAPHASPAAPHASPAAPHASPAAPHASPAAPHASPAAPHAPPMPPVASAADPSSPTAAAPPSTKAQQAKQVIFDSIPPAPMPAAPAPVRKLDEEATGQYDTSDLLRQVEAMGRRTDSGKPPDFPEPPTKPRIAISAPGPAPADGGWLDGPDEIETLERSAPPPNQQANSAARAPERREAPPQMPLAAMAQALREPTPNVSAPSPAQASERREFVPAVTAPPAAGLADSTASTAAARAGASIPAPASLPPPAHVLPSQIPPPLIHDPRANRSQTARPEDPVKAPSRARNVALGAVASVLIAGASAAIGIVALGGRNPIPAAPEATQPATRVVATTTAAPEPTVPPAASTTAAPEAVDSAAVAGQAAAPGEAAAEPGGATAAAEGEAAPAAAPPTPAARTAAASPRPPTPAASPRPAPAAARPTQAKKKKSSRYVPDDI